MTVNDPAYRVLTCPMGTNDAETKTVGEYLALLLAEVWRLDEGFDGKRPFGNSSWQDEVYVALVTAGLVEGAVDTDGYLDVLDTRAADQLILEAITFMGLGAE